MTNNTTIPSEQMDNTVSDERKAFETWALGDGPFFDVATYKDGAYKNTDLALAWSVWQARALLALKAEQQPKHPTEDCYQHFLSYSGLTDEPFLRYAYFHGADEQCDKPGPSASVQGEPQLKVHKGEICYKSKADDQSYGMWCPVMYDTEHNYPEGTMFYTHPAAQGEPVASLFLQNLHYFFAQTDGTYAWPSGSVGDLLKQAKREIEGHPSPAAQVPEGWRIAKSSDGLEISIAGPGGCCKVHKREGNATDLMFFRLVDALLSASPKPPEPPAQAVEQAVFMLGVAAEREACALLAEKKKYLGLAFMELADAIRARSSREKGGAL